MATVLDYDGVADPLREYLVATAALNVAPDRNTR
jgi:hypothetical protein